MKKKYKIIFPIVIVAGMLFGFEIANKPDPEKDKILVGLVRYALKQGHYEPHAIDDEFSEKVFTDFIDALDPYKRFFLQTDIDEFSKYRNLIDDQIKSEAASRVDFFAPRPEVNGYQRDLHSGEHAHDQKPLHDQKAPLGLCLAIGVGARF